MASLKSVRMFTDPKRKRSTKPKSKNNSSTQTNSLNSKSYSTATELLPTDAPPSNTKLLGDYIKERTKKQITFTLLTTKLQPGSRIAYVLYRMFTDRKTGEPKHVYCNSAFYQGVVGIKSASACSSEMVLTPKIVVVSGKNTYHLAENEIKKLYVYNDDRFIADPKVICNKVIRSKSNSLDHSDRHDRLATDRLAGQSRIGGATPNTSPSERPGRQDVHPNERPGRQDVQPRVGDASDKLLPGRISRSLDHSTKLPTVKPRSSEIQRSLRSRQQ